MLSISRPSDIDEDTPWGFHVFTMPQITGSLNPALALEQLRLFETAGGLETTGAPAGTGLSTLNGAVVAVVTFKESELPLTLGRMATFATERFTAVVDPDLTDDSTPSALTALSYKVLNDSATLSKQGNVIDYLQDATPAVICTTQKMVVGTTTIYGNPLQRLLCQAPPASIEEIAPLRSVTRNASEGSLVVQRFMYSLKALTTPEESAWAYASRSQDRGAQPDGTYLPLNGHKYVGSQRTTGAGITDVPTRECTNTVVKQADTRHGSFYTGQGPNSTFTITVHMVVERAPEVGSPIMQYASVPPPRSELALRAASVASKLLPVGAPASHNSLGTLLSSVMRGVSKVFGPAMQVAHMARNMPGPLGAAAGVVEDVGALLSRRHKEYKEKSPQHTDTRGAHRMPARAASKIKVTRKGRNETIQVREPKKGKARGFRPVRRG